MGLLEGCTIMNLAGYEGNLNTSTRWIGIQPTVDSHAPTDQSLPQFDEKGPNRQLTLTRNKHWDFVRYSCSILAKSKTYIVGK